MLRPVLLLASAALAVAADLPREKLLVDLDARVGLTVDAQGRVTKWVNQAGPVEARDFVGQDQGRKVPGSGLPTAPKDATEGVGFAAQELVCHDEKALDGVVRGDGCTWIAVLRPPSKPRVASRM